MNILKTTNILRAAQFLLPLLALSLVGMEPNTTAPRQDFQVEASRFEQAIAARWYHRKRRGDAFRRGHAPPNRHSIG